MLKKFENPKFRKAFVASNVRRGIAYQLRALRGKKTQAEFGKLVGKPQNVISRLEDPHYGKETIQTLIEIAAGLDVALLVKFVPYGRLMSEVENLTQQNLAPPSYEVEQKLRAVVNQPIRIIGAPIQFKPNTFGQQSEDRKNPLSSVEEWTKTGFTHRVLAPN